MAAADISRPLVDPSTIKFSKKDRQSGTIKLKRSAPKQSKPGNVKDSEVQGDDKSSTLQQDASSPPVNPMNDKLRASFTTGRPILDQPDLVQCKHCRRSVLRIEAHAHINKCLKIKADKARKKKEAKEAREREKQGIKDRDDGDKDDGKENDGEARVKASKTAINDGEDGKKGKKRKAEGESEKAPKNKKKKDEPKPKMPKPKGPVDVEKQCGVALPNGAQCARSLTCKSHSMGAKRAVPGRSLPYDMLLSQYQKKNQAKQQKAAMDANAPLQDDFDGSGPVDSDEEKDAIMTALSHWRPQPMVDPTYWMPRAIRNRRIRIKQCLEGQPTNMFAVTAWYMAGGRKMEMGSDGLSREVASVVDENTGLPTTAAAALLVNGNNTPSTTTEAEATTTTTTAPSASPRKQSSSGPAAQRKASVATATAA